MCLLDYSNVKFVLIYGVPITPGFSKKLLCSAFTGWCSRRGIPTLTLTDLLVQVL